MPNVVRFVAVSTRRSPPAPSPALASICSEAMLFVVPNDTGKASTLSCRLLPSGLTAAPEEAVTCRGCARGPRPDGAASTAGPNVPRLKPRCQAE